MATKNNKDTPTIIVCIDTTNASKPALRYACHKAKKSGCAVQILAVVESSHQNLIFGAKAISNEKRQLLEEHLDKLVDEVCPEVGIIPGISVREGDIATEIIREVKLAPNCVMITFGKSNNSLSDNTVLPKIVHRIGNKINIPVVIVPQNFSSELLEKIM